MARAGRRMTGARTATAGVREGAASGLGAIAAAARAARRRVSAGARRELAGMRSLRKRSRRSGSAALVARREAVGPVIGMVDAVSEETGTETVSAVGRVESAESAGLGMKEDGMVVQVEVKSKAPDAAGRL